MSEVQPPLPANPNDAIAYLPEQLSSLVLAAGSFWSAQAFFERLFGVAKCVAGYANGRLRHCRFEQVERGDSGFAFAVKLFYDGRLLELDDLLDIFFGLIDPVAEGHQRTDWGPQYRTGVYYSDERELSRIKQAFERCRAKHAQRLTVELCPLRNFVVAEKEQQHYLEKQPDTYRTLDFSLLDALNARLLEKSGFDGPEQVGEVREGH